MDKKKKKSDIVPSWRLSFGIGTPPGHDVLAYFE